MFCEKCGKQIPDGSAFCDGCGAKLTQEPVQAAPEAAPAAPAKPSFFATLLAKVKAIHQKNKLIFPIAGGVVVVAIALLIVFGILGKQVSVKDYMNVTTEGYDGYGYVDFDFGYTSFGMRVVGDKDVKGYDADLEEEDDFRYMEKGDVSKKYRDNFKDAQKLVDSIEYELTYPEGKENGQLSNGDVIKVKIKCKESYAEDLGLTLKDLTYEYVVEGLEPIAEFDILSYFDLVGEGYDGYGNVQLKCNYTGEKQVGGMIFEMTEGERDISYRYKDEEWTGSIYPNVRSDTYNKSNGDKVEVTIDYAEDYFVHKGVKLVNLAKEYTIDDLKESQEVDLLSYYDIQFTELNGKGRGEIIPKQEFATFGEYTVNLYNGNWTKDDEYVGYSSVYLSNSYGLSNGDTVQAYVSYSEYTFGQLGVKFVNATQDITISNLASYVNNLSEVTDYTEALNVAKEVMKEYLMSNWPEIHQNTYLGPFSNQTIGEDVNLYKVVLKTQKDSAFYNNENLMYLVLTVSLSDNILTTPTVYYVPILVADASVFPDGSLNSTTSIGCLAPYTSYDELYQKVINNNTYFEWEITESNQF